MEHLCVTLQTSCDPQKRGARDLTSTSPEPYHGRGKRMDWLTGTTFVRQQPYEGRGPLFASSAAHHFACPCSGPRASRVGPSEGERGRAGGHGSVISLVHRLAIYPQLPCQSASALQEIRRLFLPLSTQAYNYYASRAQAQAVCAKCAVDCQPGWLHRCRATPRKASPVRIRPCPIKDKSPPPPRLSSHVKVS